jgi:hypothetical protein
MLGLDLGQSSDSTALAVLEQVMHPHPSKPPGWKEAHYGVKYLKR